MNLAEASACPSEEELQIFLYGSPNRAQVLRIEAHIDSCTVCHELVAALGRADTGATPEHLGPPPPVAPALGRGFAVGRYLVLDPIGSGGMGVVYAAYDSELGRKVALKLLRSELCDQDGAERLRREAQWLARLSHPNVVCLYDAGTFGGQSFLVMELVLQPQQKLNQVQT